MRDGPGPGLSGVSLAALSDNPELCLFTLGQSGLSFVLLPDSRTSDGCSLSNALEVEGGSLSYNKPFVATCRLAAAIAILEEQVVQPAARARFGQGVVAIEQWGTYACRRRNHRSAGPLSEHARANAIDVAAFELADGRRITVEHGWRAGGREAAFLREVRDGACGIFNGIISPDSDADHRDHLHFDMGRWRFCR